MSGSDPARPAPRVELICTGAELLGGFTVNTHTRLLGSSLASLGMTLARETTVPDGIPEIADAVRDAMRRAQILFISGGLGPTTDDLTREALSEALGRNIVFDPEALRAIRERCARIGQPCTASRERQAQALSGAEALQNSAGMAPGQWMETGACVLIVLPGPPREFRAILEDHVLPRLRRRFPIAPPREALFRICGLAESDLAEALERDGFAPGRAEFACCARPGCLDVRLRAPAEGEADLVSAAQAIRRIAGSRIVEESLRPLEEVVVERLRAARRSLAVAESCTGGLIGSRLTAVPGCSEIFPGGIVAYSNVIKARHLGVPQTVLAASGAVSEPVARAMAQGVRAAFGADFGLAVTGIAGPGGATPDKPVGLVWIAVAGPDAVRAEEFRFAGPRDVVREGATHLALDLVRRSL